MTGFILSLSYIKEVKIMTQDEKHSLALMRYGAIAPLISGTKTNFKV